MRKHTSLILIVLATFVLSACGSDDSNSSDGAAESTQTAGQVNDTNVAEDENENVDESASAPDSSEADATNSKPVKSVEPVSLGSEGGINPTAVEIPAIDVQADIIQVGIDDSGAMEVPDNGDSVGWYNRGAKPGANGNAVLAGHVDDRTGPAIFYNLEDLEVGDDIIVTGEDGTILTFQVTDRAVYPYNDAPVQKVFGRSSAKQLNLITCTGEFDRDNGTHRERLVIFTELVDETRA